MSPKRFTIPELETEIQRRRRIADEVTKAADCRFVVKHVPLENYGNEEVLPARMRESRGHLFRVEFVPPSIKYRQRFSLDTLIDDRDGSVFDELAEHLRDLAEAFGELATSVEAAGRKEGGA